MRMICFLIYCPITAAQEPAGKLEEGLMVNPDAIEEAMAQALGRLEPASEVNSFSHLLCVYAFG